MLFQEKSLGDCSSCRFWHSSPLSADAYVGVEVYDPPLALDRYFQTLGECRRMPPSAHVTVCISTEKESDKYHRALKDYEAEYFKAEGEWVESRGAAVRAAEARLETIKESLATCRSESLSHWQAELDKQEGKIKELLDKQRQEGWPSDFWRSHHPEPELKTFKALKGVWPLTASDEFCGEWQQR